MGDRMVCGASPREAPDDGIQEREVCVVRCGGIMDRPMGREGAVRSYELAPVCKTCILQGKYYHVK